MALVSGTRLGSYEIVAPIGSGGMGEVYRARDTKLGRDVAIKVLPHEFTTDPGRLARFEREARVLAALNHPHIAAIYGVEQMDGLRGLVLELVEGDTIADRLRRGPVPLTEALTIARQIAEALDAAHEKGIVHRDLKPANIKITARGAPPPRAKDLALERRLSRPAMPDGIVKVLDFGLAKIEDEPGAQTDSSNLSTITLGGTKEGAVLGTAAYMSPEQARGQPVDKRTDIWAFGCVVFEMLSGRLAFPGPTTSDAIAAILEREPDWSLLPLNTPASVRWLLRRCLAKDPRQRLRDIGDAVFELTASAESHDALRQSAHGAAASLVSEGRRRTILGIAVGAVVAAIVTGAGTWMLRGSSAPARTTRLTLPMAEDQQFGAPSNHHLAISPDGRTIVYAANGRLYIRQMGDSEARPIPGTDAIATQPVFSPDGLSIAFWAVGDGTLKKIGVAGGVAVTLCPVETPTARMDWGPGGIAFASLQGIVRVSPHGGKPEVLVRRAEDEYDINPQVVANGDVVVFTRVPTKEWGGARWEGTAQIVAQSIRSGERHVVLTGGAEGRYLPTGHLIYAVGGTLYAVRFDLTRLSLAGAPTSVIEGLRRGLNGGPTAQYAVSDSGSLIYLSGPKVPGGQLSLLVQVDRNGQIAPLWLPSGLYPYPRYSPDGTRAVFGLVEQGQPRQIGIYDLSGASEVRRLTFNGENRYPIWTPDGVRITYESDRDSAPGLFWQRADGTGAAERLTTAERGRGHVPDSWSPDGKTLLFEIADAKTLVTPMQRGRFSLWALSLRDRRIERFGTLESQTSIDGTFSPDGRWVAYDVDEGAGPRVHVEPFPRTGERYLVTNERGWNPFWSPRGEELYYSPGPDRFRLVTFVRRPTVAFSNFVQVPRGRIWEPGGDSIDRREYDLSPDGKRILGNVVAPTRQQALAPTIEVVLNWTEELKAKVP